MTASDDGGLVVQIYLPSVKMKPWLLDSVRQIVTLTTLPPDWDSYGGRSTSIRAAISATKLLGLLTHFDVARPSIIPTSEGFVQLEWHRGGVDLEIEVRPTNRIRVWYENAHTGETLDQEFVADYSPILRLGAAVSAA